MKGKLIALGLSAVLATITTAQAGGDIAAGKEKSSNCAGCHGTDGRGNAQNPPLTGLEKRYIAQQLRDFKSGAREHAMMKMFASKLSNEDMVDLAAYYASLKNN